MPIAIILQILQILPALIKLVESIFGKGNGAEKKAAVTTLIPLALEMASELSKGGQKSSIDAIKDSPALGATIDAVAGALFPSGTTIETLNPSE